MNIRNEHLQELTKLGYSERESAFLYTVATFSGYFLRKQFEKFIGVSHGRPAHDFIEKCIQQDHVHELPYVQSNHRRYHLFSRVVYRAIGKENSANRKAGSECKANSKLRVLEFVLSHFKYEYLEEEPDKVEFFTKQKNIGIDALPVKVFDGKVPGQNTTRYFIDKFPILLGESKSDGDLIPAWIGMTMVVFLLSHALRDCFKNPRLSVMRALPLGTAVDQRSRLCWASAGGHCSTNCNVSGSWATKSNRFPTRCLWKAESRISAARAGAII